MGKITLISNPVSVKKKQNNKFSVNCTDISGKEIWQGKKCQDPGGLKWEDAGVSARGCGWSVRWKMMETVAVGKQGWGGEWREGGEEKKIRTIFRGLCSEERVQGKGLWANRSNLNMAQSAKDFCFPLFTFRSDDDPTSPRHQIRVKRKTLGK